MARTPGTAIESESVEIPVGAQAAFGRELFDGGGMPIVCTAEVKAAAQKGSEFS